MAPPETPPVWLTSADGTPIALHHLGGEGPPMLVCHATGFHARCYLPMAAILAADHAVWGVDVRGHGLSQLPHDATFDWHDIANDVLAAIDHLGGGPLPAFGHSMGGATILLAEATKPGSIAAGYLFEPIVFPEHVEAERNSGMSEAARRRRAEFPSRAEALARYASRPPLNLMRADALWAYVEYGFLDDDRSESPDGSVRLACRPEFEAMTFEAADVPVHTVSSVAVPITVARGATTPMPGPADFAESTAEALPSGSLVTYPDLTHFGPMEAPDRIATDAHAALTRS